jgi:DNA recombination protein RmuC
MAFVDSPWQEIGLVAAFASGVLVTWIWSKQAIVLAREKTAQEVRSARETEVRDLATRLAVSEQRGVAFEEALGRMQEVFRGLSAEALRENQKSFLDLAQERWARSAENARSDWEARERAVAALVAPLRESLQSMDAKVTDLERNRAGAYEGLREMMGVMDETQRGLRAETGRLVQALQSPVVRGRWGEIQLRRVVELAGMLAHCDFVEQDSVESPDGKQRPDLRVMLPGGHSVVIDSKVPLLAYLEAVQASDVAERKRHLGRHASQVRAHVEQLSRKSYWEQFSEAPEFVVLFLPGEVFFSAALEQDAELIGFAAERRVILASPTTLIALLRAVHTGWRREAVARNAAEISALGREIHKRLGDFAGHLNRMGASLGGAVENFNRAIASLEARVLVSARKFEQLGAAHAEESLAVPGRVEKLPVGFANEPAPDDQPPGFRSA